MTPSRCWLLPLWEQVFFWVVLFIPTHLTLYRYVLPFAGAPNLGTAFAFAALLHAVLFAVTSLSDPGLVTLTPGESERLIEQGALQPSLRYPTPAPSCAEGSVRRGQG